MSALMPRAITYLKNLPAAIPEGQVLVHNQVRPAKQLGTRGFRAWLVRTSPGRRSSGAVPMRVGE
jgi:hypothetical protein